MIIFFQLINFFTVICAQDDGYAASHFISKYVDDTSNWSLSENSNNSLSSMAANGLIDVFEWGYLDNVLVQVQCPRRNEWTNIEKDLRSKHNFLSGTTFWINEFMTVGHALMDIELIQVLDSIKIDRIIIQRCRICTPGLSEGIGTWESFFKAYFAAAINAFQPRIPIYIRNKSPLRAHFLSIDKQGIIHEEISHDDIISLNEDDRIYMERLIRSARDKTPKWNIHMQCCSPNTVAKFKSSAYKLISDTNTPSKNSSFIDRIPAGYPINVTYAFRDVTFGRHANNTNHVCSVLSNLLKYPKFNFECIPTFNKSINYIPQIHLMSRIHVLITEHGAFLSNLIYMRARSLLIMLRGNYDFGMDHDYITANVAESFGIYFKVVLNNRMKDHGQNEFEITSDEILKLSNIILKYENIIFSKT